MGAKGPTGRILPHSQAQEVSYIKCDDKPEIFKPRKQMKSSRAAIFTAAPVLAVSLLLVGCAREVSHQKTTSVHSNGTVTSKEKTVTESPNGTVTTEEKKNTTPTRP